MNEQPIRVCVDYTSTKECFSYLLIYGPKLPAEGHRTLKEVFTDFRLGVVDSLEAAGHPEGTNERAGLLNQIDMAHRLFLEKDIKMACNLLQDAQEDFKHLCSRKKRR